ncbi:MAG: VWA domain-containing protein [Anaerolineales bacterium]
MTFTNPPALILLLLLIPIILWGLPRRGRARTREGLALLLRVLIFTALIFALAGFSLRRTTDQMATIFLLDVSDSVPMESRAFGVGYAQKAVKAMRPEDRAALILFGGEALIDQPLQTNPLWGTPASIPRSDQTDLSAAIRLALALYPPDAARRLVILSDGRETLGDARAALEVARASGVDVMAVTLLGAQSNSASEVILRAVKMPPRLRENEPFDLTLEVSALQNTAAGVRVLAAGEILYEGEINLRKGTQTLRLPLRAGTPGFVQYRVELFPAADGFFQNNTLSTFSRVDGPPRVLVVAPPAGEPLGFGGEMRPDEAGALVRALQSAGMTVDTLRPAALPSDLARLAEYASVILVDVPAREFSPRQMEALRLYVRDLGGGLVAVGGPTAFGVGGYYRTPLEAALPIEMLIKDEQRRPSLTMVFIIDRSGSMTESSGGVSKLDLAKEAAMRSVELMMPTDQIGVIAFDDAAQWVVPIREVADTTSVVGAIARIDYGGGTDIYAGLQAMATRLPQVDSSIKHVILLTDGGADQTGIPELVRRLYEDNGITLTTVGVGNDAAPYLEDLAKIGGGRYHFANNPGSIPSIFTEETALVSRSYIVEETFSPLLVSSSPVLSGLDALPPLYGYVGSTVKSTAQLVLATPREDPLLAIWQYGLGRSLVFTSDASGRWAKDWLAWQGFETFWVQAVRFTLAQPPASNLQVTVTEQDGRANIVAEARTPGSAASGVFLNDARLMTNVVLPDGTSITTTLTQSGPGIYNGWFTPSDEGVYLLRIQGETQSGETVADTVGWARNYSPEYRDLNAAPDALARWVTPERLDRAPETVFAARLPAPVAIYPLWGWLLALAMTLLPLDVAARRLALPPLNGRALLATLRTRAALRKQEKPQAPVVTSKVEGLLQVKQRIPKAGAPLREQDISLPQQKETPIIVPPPPNVPEKPAAPVVPPQTGESTAAALLRRKRENRE